MTLRLRKREISELTPDELAAVAGGTVTYGCTVTRDLLCLTHRLSLEECS